MMRFLFVTVAVLLAVSSGCVSGNKIRADAEVIRADVERARRSGAYRCAPKELAAAEANLDFALGELSEGSSSRAAEHIRTADASAKRAIALSRECGPKQVLVKEKPVEKPVVVEVQETDRDNDGIKDVEDQCPEEAEDRDEFQDQDGCPDPDNDGDGILDTEDKCPNTKGAKETAGCPREDADGDGIPDDVDRCRDQAEDRDGFQDEDGCPELDNDADGLLDAADKCPTEAGPPQNFGCPIVDKDADGINDDKDKCPEEPEDKDDFQDDDGCPDLDNDQDGLPDGQDQCPIESGPAENKGCPDTDRDGDTIVDRLDKCPDEPGVAEEQGCAKKYKMIVVQKDKIQIKQQIRFASGSHRIVGRDSFSILDEVAQALKDNAHIKKVRIEGHTDSVGSDASNLRLSQRRADEVMAQLLKRGVDPGRMEAVGFGEANPIASNGTAAGRAENRRTEFNIVEQ